MRVAFTKSALALVMLAACARAEAQLSLSTAVDLAEKNSPRVKMAESDVAKARASLGSAKDAYIPLVSTTGGYGRSTGAPLGVPVIFSISAQSLLFSFSQSNYVRAAGAGVHAAEHALAEVRVEVAEDTTNTYLALNNALQRQRALQQAGDISAHLVQVLQDRYTAGVENRMELTKAQITATQIKLQILSIQDEVAENSQHLATLTGLGAGALTTDANSVPKFAPLAPAAATPHVDSGYSEGIAAAYEIAKSKQLTAQGDHRYLLLPQVTLQSNYSRVDTGLSSYTDYYPRFAGTPGSPNSQNSLGFGASITIPLLDFSHRSHARESAADAAHALADAHQQESVFLESRAKLHNNALELDARAELARLNQQLAQDQLETVRVQMEPAASALSGPLVTPKDELNAELQERQRYLDVLKADLQLEQVRVNLLRQQGRLTDFLHQAITATPVMPSDTPALPQPGPSGLPQGATPPTISGSGVTGGSVPNVPQTSAPGTKPQL